MKVWKGWYREVVLAQNLKWCLCVQFCVVQNYHFCDIFGVVSNRYYFTILLKMLTLLQHLKFQLQLTNQKKKQQNKTKKKQQQQQTKKKQPMNRTWSFLHHYLSTYYINSIKWELQKSSDRVACLLSCEEAGFFFPWFGFIWAVIKQEHQLQVQHTKVKLTIKFAFVHIWEFKMLFSIQKSKVWNYVLVIKSTLFSSLHKTLL